MKTYDFRQSPFKLFGVPFFDLQGRMERLPASLSEKLPATFREWHLDRRCPGARLCFQTDSARIALRITFENLSPDIGMSIYSCQSANVYIGPRQSARYAGLVFPQSYDAPFAEGTIEKAAELEEITIYLPRNEIITDIKIRLDDGAVVKEPTPYRYSPPILYYGNSVTEGACCSKSANAYCALVSRWLDADYINFGFSGSAKGELEMAEYINTIDKRVLVMDYDHNASDADSLWKTHEPFFRVIRKHSPALPVVMMSASNFEWCRDAAARREVIRETYDRARASGDENVYFVDGETLWGDQDRDACSADTIHPNDLGMYRTACVLAPLIRKILEKQESSLK